MPDSLSAERAQGTPHALRTDGFACVGVAMQPIAPRVRKRFGEQLWRIANLWPAEAERDDSSAGRFVRRQPPGDGHRGLRMAADDVRNPAHFDAERVLRARSARVHCVEQRIPADAIWG